MNALMEQPSKQIIIILLFPLFTQSKYEITFKKGFAYEKLGSVSYISNFINITREISFSHIGNSIEIFKKLDVNLNGSCNDMQKQNYMPSSNYIYQNEYSYSVKGASAHCQHDTHLPIIEDEQVKHDLLSFMNKNKIRRCWLGTTSIGIYGTDRRAYWENGKPLSDILFPTCHYHVDLTTKSTIKGVNTECSVYADGFTLTSSGIIEPWSLRNDHGGDTSQELLGEFPLIDKPKVVCQQKTSFNDRNPESAISRSLCESMKGRWNKQYQIYSERYNHILGLIYFKAQEKPRSGQYSITKGNLRISKRKKRAVSILTAGVSAIKAISGIYKDYRIHAAIDKNAVAIDRLIIDQDSLQRQFNLVQKDISDIVQVLKLQNDLSTKLNEIQMHGAELSAVIDHSLNVLEEIVYLSLESKPSAHVLPPMILNVISGPVIAKLGVKLKFDYPSMKTAIIKMTNQSFDIVTRVPGYNTKKQTLYKIYPIPNLQKNKIAVVPNQWFTVSDDQTEFIPVTYSTYKDCTEKGCIKPSYGLNIQFAPCGIAQLFTSEPNWHNCQLATYEYPYFITKTNTGLLYAFRDKTTTKVKCGDQIHELSLKKPGHLKVGPGCTATVYLKNNAIFAIDGPVKESTFDIDQGKFVNEEGEPIDPDSVGNTFEVQLNKYENTVTKNITLYIIISVVILVIIIGIISYLASHLLTLHKYISAARIYASKIIEIAFANRGKNQGVTIEKSGIKFGSEKQNWDQAFNRLAEENIFPRVCAFLEDARSTQLRDQYDPSSQVYALSREPAGEVRPHMNDHLQVEEDQQSLQQVTPTESLQNTPINTKLYPRLRSVELGA